LEGQGPRPIYQSQATQATVAAAFFKPAAATGEVRKNKNKKIKCNSNSKNNAFFLVGSLIITPEAYFIIVILPLNSCLVF
jgi:hypothetical protein